MPAKQSKYSGSRRKHFDNINTAIHHKDDIYLPSYALGLLTGVSIGVVFTIVAFLWAITG